MLRLVQLTHRIYGRCVAIVEENYLRRLNTHHSVYELATAAIDEGRPIEEIATEEATTERMKYEPIYSGSTDWSFLPAFDHPLEPNSCLVSGTGLTHRASAANRQAMHEDAGHEELTDSMQIYEWGVEGGRPAQGDVGAQPEWFYKGHGSILRGHLDALQVPVFSDDGGEEPEVAGAYIVDAQGRPRRIGFMTANEFSDHILEKTNYLYLAPSKLRTCAIGPELIVGGEFEDVSGKVSVHRDGDVLWCKDVHTGESNMSHSLANLEHHHFKYDVHRNPGDAHVYFYGADAFSFGEGVKLVDGDTMTVAWEGLGKPLVNTIKIQGGIDELVVVEALE